MRKRQCLCGAAQVALRQCTTYETQRSVKHNYPNSFSENAKVRLDNGARRSCQTCSHHLFARVCGAVNPRFRIALPVCVI